MPKTIELDKVVPGYEKGAKKFIVEDTVNNKVEILTRSDLEKKPEHVIKQADIMPFQSDIVDGASRSVAETYLQKEFPLLLKFFKKKGIQSPKITYDFDTTDEYWLQVDFPLPRTIQLDKDGKTITHRYKYPIEKMTFILNGYPDFPPVGFFVLKSSPNIEVFETVFQTHLFDKALLEKDHVAEAMNRDWHWICFHYKDNTWKFDRQHIQNGDSLAQFFNTIYWKIAGLEGVSR